MKKVGFLAGWFTILLLFYLKMSLLQRGMEFAFSPSFKCHFQVTGTESQNGWGGNGPLEVIWANPPVQAGPPSAICPRLCPDTPAFLWSWNRVIRCCWGALMLLDSGHTGCVLCFLERHIAERIVAWRSFSERREMLRDAYLRRVYGKYRVGFPLYRGEGNQ